MLVLAYVVIPRGQLIIHRVIMFIDKTSWQMAFLSPTVTEHTATELHRLEAKLPCPYKNQKSVEYSSVSLSSMENDLKASILIR